MDDGSKLLIGFMEAMISRPSNWKSDDYPVRMQACMVLDKVASDLMDTAGSLQRTQELSATYLAVKRAVLHADQSSV